jgi:hypothetical protein
LLLFALATRQKVYAGANSISDAPPVSRARNLTSGIFAVSHRRQEIHIPVDRGTLLLTHMPAYARLRFAQPLARSKRISRTPSLRMALNLSSGSFVFRKLHPSVGYAGKRIAIESSRPPHRRTIRELTSASLSITEQATRANGAGTVRSPPVRRQSSMPEFLPTFTCR